MVFSRCYTCAHQKQKILKKGKIERVILQLHCWAIPVSVSLDSTVVVASLLTGYRRWHDMFSQQTVIPSFPLWIKSNQCADAVWLELWYYLIAQRLSLTHTVVSITDWFTGTIPHMQATRGSESSGKSHFWSLQCSLVKWQCNLYFRSGGKSIYLD